MKYSIGEVIRQERKRQSIRQEDLADGICSTAWLSRIESGACIPTVYMFEVLMQRLGNQHHNMSTIKVKKKWK